MMGDATHSSAQTTVANVAMIETNAQDAAASTSEQQSGVKIKSMSDNSKEPLHQSSMLAAVEIVKILLGQGVKSNQGLEPVHRASDNAEVLNLLLSSKCIDVNVPSEGGWTPLHFAVRANNSECIGILLKNGALVNKSDREGVMPLIAQSKNFSFLFDENIKCLDCVEVLLDRGGCTFARDERGQTALHCATENELVYVMERLMSRGCCVDELDCAGDSPLHIAVRNQSLEVVSTLLDWGADMGRHGGMKETVFDIAEQSLTAFNVWNYSFEILIKHAARLITASIPLQLDNALIRLYKRISSEFVRRCSDEVADMKKITIEGPITYYNILTAKQHKLSSYVRNQNIQQAFKQADYIANFPLYSTILTSQARRGLHRNFLTDESFKFFQSFTGLPFDCFQHICDYLSISDLNTLAHSFNYKSVTDGFPCTVCSNTRNIPRLEPTQPYCTKRLNLIKMLNY